MNNLQDMFKKAEDNVQERLDGLPIFGSYKEVLKQILNLPQLIEWAWANNISNDKQIRYFHSGSRGHSRRGGLE